MCLSWLTTASASFSVNSCVTSSEKWIYNTVFWNTTYKLPICNIPCLTLFSISHSFFYFSSCESQRANEASAPTVTIATISWLKKKYLETPEMVRWVPIGNVIIHLSCSCSTWYWTCGECDHTGFYRIVSFMVSVKYDRFNSVSWT